MTLISDICMRLNPFIIPLHMLVRRDKGTGDDITVSPGDSMLVVGVQYSKIVAHVVKGHRVCTVIIAVALGDEIPSREGELQTCRDAP